MKDHFIYNHFDENIKLYRCTINSCSRTFNKENFYRHLRKKHPKFCGISSENTIDETEINASFIDASFNCDEVISEAFQQEEDTSSSTLMNINSINNLKSLEEIFLSFWLQLEKIINFQEKM